MLFSLLPAFRRKLSSSSVSQFLTWGTEQPSGKLFECGRWELSLHHVRLGHGGGAQQESAHSLSHGSAFGFVTRGEVEVHEATIGAHWHLRTGQYWSSPHGCVVRAPREPSNIPASRAADAENRALIVEKLGFVALASA